jgi:hypothetical protein
VFPPARARSVLSTEPAILLGYLVVSILFTIVYYRSTMTWSEGDFAACVNLTGPWPAYKELFGCRVLMPALAWLVRRATGADYWWVFRCLTTLTVGGILVTYRAYLSNFMRRGFATLASIAIVYPMIWNLCLLNRLYYPFDVPALLLFVLGCHLIHRQRWVPYYVVLVLAALNREAGLLLVLVQLLVSFGRVPLRKLAAHAVAQLAAVFFIRFSVSMIVRGAPPRAPLLTVETNLAVLGDMLALRGNALRDWAKFLLSFGGLWVLIPWAVRGLPRTLRRGLLAAVPALGIVLVYGIADEMRLYSEFIPLLLTPVLYRAHSRFRPGL